MLNASIVIVALLAGAGNLILVCGRSLSAQVSPRLRPAAETPSQTKTDPISFQRCDRGRKLLRFLEHPAGVQVKINAGKHVANAEAARDTMLRNHGELSLNVLNVVDAAWR